MRMRRPAGYFYQGRCPSSPDPTDWRPGLTAVAEERETRPTHPSPQDRHAARKERAYVRANVLKESRLGHNKKRRKKKKPTTTRPLAWGVLFVGGRRIMDPDPILRRPTSALPFVERCSPTLAHFMHRVLPPSWCLFHGSWTDRGRRRARTPDEVVGVLAWPFCCCLMETDSSARR
jgi:hypothetical protein